MEIKNCDHCHRQSVNYREEKICTRIHGKLPTTRTCDYFQKKKFCAGCGELIRVDIYKTREGKDYHMECHIKQREVVSCLKVEDQGE